MFCAVTFLCSNNSFYSDYEASRPHFQAKHFVCEDEACADEKCTSVFRTEIDLRGKNFVLCFYYSVNNTYDYSIAHIASTHRQSIGKLATKQVRTLEVEFTLAPRNRLDEYSRGAHRNNYGEYYNR